MQRTEFMRSADLRRRKKWLINFALACSIQLIFNFRMPIYRISSILNGKMSGILLRLFFVSAIAKWLTQRIIAKEDQKIGFSLFCHPFFAVWKWQSEVKRLWYSLVKVTVSITRLSISKCSIFVLQKHPTLFVITRCFATVNAVAILILYFRFEKFIIDTVCERVPALTPTCASDYSTFT